MSINFYNPVIKKFMTEGFFGIEKESLRVNETGYLSDTKHPFENNPNIDRDFCENQVEIVTDVYGSIDELYAHLTDIHNTLIEKLAELETGRELLWLFSSPPYIKSEDEIPVASFRGVLKGKEIYRQYLAKKYGRKKMLFSGIHFNFSFGENLINACFREHGKASYREYKESIYLELAKKLTRYSWLIVYLTAASPLMDSSYFCDGVTGKTVITPYSSVRCSDIGYWNSFTPVLEYESVSAYIDSVQKYVDKGLLKSFSELYYPVRLKSVGENSPDKLKKSGINHIELRTLDLNPLSPVGIMKEDIEFLHILILYLISSEDEEFDADEQIKAVNNVKSAARYDDGTMIEFGGKMLSVRSCALEVLDDIRIFSEKLCLSNALKNIQYQKDKILGNKRYAEIIKNKFSNNFIEKGLRLSSDYVKIRSKEVASHV